MKKGLLLAMVCFLVSGPLFSENGQSQIPDITITDIQGKKISFSALKGKIIILNFWATWCPPCRTEIPDFIDAYAQHKNDGMVIIGISLDRGGPAVVKNFAETNKINYPLAMMTREIYQSFDIGQYIPATFIIDRQGKIIQKKVGPMTKENLDQIFEVLSGDKENRL
ncbi:MAG: TlpA family protein disulfide reductase [Candidatus Aminicenantes bacterium]|nr:TlpA family protein disulfide reductase [Candidatus Aminicenantes bacterium]